MRQGKLSSLLIAPEDLIKYLRDISKHLRNGTMVVAENTINLYYDIIQVSAWIVDDHIVRLFLNVPLKNADRTSMLYKVLPVPIRTFTDQGLGMLSFVQESRTYKSGLWFISP